jgi:single-strand DNA-binding protein
LSTRKWKDEASGQDKYSTEIVLQGFNSTFTILSAKSSQSTSIQDNTETKSSLPNEKDISSKDLDDEIPF